MNGLALQFFGRTKGKTGDGSGVRCLLREIGVTYHHVRNADLRCRSSKLTAKRE